MGAMFANRNARHAAKGDLHGITVVVDTTGAELYIGRFFEQRGDGIVLLDVARHSDGANGVSKEQYVQTAARFGQWKELRAGGGAVARGTFGDALGRCRRLGACRIATGS